MRLWAAYREINGFERSRMTLDTSRNPLFLADVTMPLKGLLLFGMGSERVTIELPQLGRCFGDRLDWCLSLAGCLCLGQDGVDWVRGVAIASKIEP